MHYNIRRKVIQKYHEVKISKDLVNMISKTRSPAIAREVPTICQCPKASKSELRVGSVPLFGT